VTTLYPFRFFLAMGLHAPYGLIVLAAVVVTTVCMVASAPLTGVDDGVGMLLFVQMFLASSGFSERARRGHFDPLLTFPSNRRMALIAHWTISVLPGVAGWLTIAAAAFLFRSPVAGSTLWGGRAAAMFIVSAVAWVAGFALARGTAGFLWTAALLAVMFRRADIIDSSSALSFVFCPFVLMKPGAPDTSAALAAVLIAGVPLLWVWRNAATLDIDLRERV
jgi:hypothetical protein